MELHPCLRKTQEVVAHGIRSYILWDIREHPLSAQVVQQLPLRLPSEILNAYATYPPVASLIVTCEYPKFWSTTVYATAATSQSPAASYPTRNASHSGAAGITVTDLLTAIYNHLHSQPVSTTDLHNLHSKQRTRLLEAYDKRKKTVRGAAQQLRTVLAPHYAHNSQQTMAVPSTASYGSGALPIVRGSVQEGVKLVDTFLLHTLFAGLEVDPENPYTMNLSVKRPT